MAGTVGLRLNRLWCPPGVRRRQKTFFATFQDFRSALELGLGHPWNPNHVTKLGPCSPCSPRKNRDPGTFSLQEIFLFENRRFLFSPQRPETRRWRPGPSVFDYLDFGLNISSAGDVLSRVLLDFFFLEDLHEVFSPRSTRYNPTAARRPFLSFISNLSLIF